MIRTELYVFVLVKLISVVLEQGVLTLAIRNCNFLYKHMMPNCIGDHYH